MSHFHSLHPIITARRHSKQAERVTANSHAFTFCGRIAEKHLMLRTPEFHISKHYLTHQQFLRTWLFNGLLSTRYFPKHCQLWRKAVNKQVLGLSSSCAICCPWPDTQEVEEGLMCVINIYVNTQCYSQYSSINHSLMFYGTIHQCSSSNVH